MCTYDVDPNSLKLALYIANGNCTKYLYSSTPLLGKCIPTSPIPISNSSLNNSNTATDFTSAQGLLSAGQNGIMTAVSDIATGWKVLAASSGIVIILCLLWLLLLQLLAGPMVWFTILSCNIVMILGSFWLYIYWQSQQIRYNNTVSGSNSTLTGIVGTAGNYAQVNSQVSLLSQSEINYISYAFYLIAIISGLLILLSIAMIKKISMAIQVLKIASKACMRMPFISIFFE